MRVLIIIPAYNEEASIASVVKDIRRQCPNYDYLVVNDASNDSTGQICKENGINHISLPINVGIGGTVQCGYMYAMENNYDIAVQFDGDGQHDPAYIEKLIEPLFTGEADLVVGSRFLEKKGFQTSFIRRLGIWFIKQVIVLCCGVSVRDTTSGFRAANKDLIHLYAKEYPHDYPEPEAIVAAVLNGYRVKEVAAQMNERQGGVSSISPLRSMYYMIKVPLSLMIYKLSTRRTRLR